METSRAAFEAIFRAHYDDLLHFAVRRVGADAAPDVVADVFLVAWRRRAVIPGDAARLWLFGVATNVINNERRAQARRARLVARAAAEPIDTNGNDPIDVTAGVRQAFDSLPEMDREALRLSEWEQLTPAEAGLVLGCSAATFRVRVHRARRRLAAAVFALNSSIIPAPGQDVIA